MGASSWHRRRGTWAARAGAVAALLAALVAPSAAAQTTPGAPFAGLTVTTVRLEEEGRTLSEAGLLDLVETPPGQPLSLLRVRDSIAHLFGLGRFQDVQVDAALEGDGVALVYRLVPLRAVARVEFQGDTGLSKGRLRDALAERFGGSPPIGRADAAARALEELYVSFGYTRARVTPSAITAGDGRQTVLVFDVVAGPRARLGAITVAGQTLIAETGLLDRLDLRTGGYYDRGRLDERLARYVTDLRARGYYEASATHDSVVRDDGATIALSLTVEAGPLVSLSFAGDPLPPDRQQDLVPVEREGSVDEDLLEDSDRRIERYLLEEGHWRAQVSHRRTQADDRLDVVFTVRRGPRYLVSSVELAGNDGVPESELRPLVRFGKGDPFVVSRLDADVAAIARYYRSLGYAQVAVSTTVEETSIDTASGPPAAQVTVRLLIDEGPRTLVARVEIEGHDAMPADELRARLQSKPGEPFSELRAVADRDALARLYANRGYQSATVQVDRRFDEDETSVDLIFVLQEGAQSVVDHLIVVGNSRTSTDTILRELPLGPGDPIGFDDLIDAQRRLAALGLFRRVTVSQLEHGSGTRRDLLVTVEEAPATTVGYGGGVEAGRRLRPGQGGGPAEERIEFAPRGFFEIGRRNLWGKNRSVNLYTRISVRRSDNVEHPEQSGLGFNEYRVVGSYREPRAFGTDADLLVNTFFEQAVRTSFNFNRKGVTAEVSKQVDPPLRLVGRYAFGYTRLFDERLNPEDQLLIDRLFPQVRLSTFSSSLVHDTRDDPIDPAAGGWVALDGELSLRSLGSRVGYAKTYLQGFVYRRVSRPRRIVLALGARLGLATGFERDVEVTDANGNPVLGPDGRPLVTVVKDLPASERFFTGGDTTARGFAIDRLGTPDTIDQNGFPKGGNGLVLFNAELRAPLWRSLGVVGFIDAGNVFARAGSLNLGEMRGNVGFGLRYQSPIGPLRVDLGFKLDRRVVAGRREPLTALHISFGQAF